MGYDNELRGLDAWLERPYQDMMERSDDFVEWAESEGYDLDDLAQIEEAEEAYFDYLDYLAEDEAENLRDGLLERLEMEADERDYWENDGDYY